MRFKNYLDEVFDNPYKYKLVDNSYGMEGNFYDDEGNFFTVNFDFETYSQFPYSRYDNKNGDFEKAIKDGELTHKFDLVDIMFDKNGRYEMTKSNAFRVFATIKTMLKDSKSQILKEGGDLLSFQGKTSDKGRIKFYQSILKYAQKELGYKYSQTYIRKNNDTMFLAYNDPEIKKILG